MNQIRRRRDVAYVPLIRSYECHGTTDDSDRYHNICVALRLRPTVTHCYCCILWVRARLLSLSYSALSLFDFILYH